MRRIIAVMVLSSFVATVPMAQEIQYSTDAAVERLEEALQIQEQSIKALELQKERLESRRSVGWIVGGVGVAVSTVSTLVAMGASDILLYDSMIVTLGIGLGGIAAGAYGITENERQQEQLSMRIQGHERQLGEIGREIEVASEGYPVVLRTMSIRDHEDRRNVSLRISFKNISHREIKYIYAYFAPYNRVYDPVMGRDGRSALSYIEAVGPILPGRSLSESYYFDWPTSEVEYVRLEHIDIVFLDDTELSFQSSTGFANSIVWDAGYDEVAARIGNDPYPTLVAPPSPSASSKAAEPEGTEEGVIQGTGSGFFITEDGYFVTNHHVVAGADRIEVLHRNEWLRALVMAAVPHVDLAVLKVEDSGRDAFAYLPVRIEAARLGQEVFTVGFPDPGVQGVSPKLTTGVVSSIAGIRDDPRVYQVSVPVQPGSSGGPLIDDRGAVVGVIVSRLDDAAAFSRTGSLPQNVNYAVKSSRLVPLLSDLGLLSRVNPSGDEAVSIVEANEHAINSAGLVVRY